MSITIISIKSSVIIMLVKKDILYIIKSKHILWNAFTGELCPRKQFIFLY